MASELPRGLRGTRRPIAGEEEARYRLARELHDDHCQRLAALSFELKAVRRDFAEGAPRRTGLDAVDASLAELGEDLRRLSHDLHPAILERRGLARTAGSTRRRPPCAVLSRSRKPSGAAAIRAWPRPCTTLGASPTTANGSRSRNGSWNAPW